MDAREIIELIAKVYSGAPFPSRRSLDRATDVLDAISDAGCQIIHDSENHGPTLERVEAIVDAEPELPGDPPEHVIKAMEEIGPVGNARSSCRATKRSILAAIRAMEVKRDA